MLWVLLLKRRLTSSSGQIPERVRLWSRTAEIEEPRRPISSHTDIAVRTSILTGYTFVSSDREAGILYEAARGGRATLYSSIHDLAYGGTKQFCYTVLFCDCSVSKHFSPVLSFLPDKLRKKHTQPHSHPMLAEIKPSHIGAFTPPQHLFPDDRNICFTLSGKTPISVPKIHHYSPRGFTAENLWIAAKASRMMKSKDECP